MLRALTSASVAPFERQEKGSFPQFEETIAKLQALAEVADGSEYVEEWPYAIKLRETSDIAALNTRLSEFLQYQQFPGMVMFRTTIGSLGWFGHMDYAYDIYKLAKQEYKKNFNAYKLTAQIFLSAAACQRQDILDLLLADLRFFQDEQRLLVIDRIFKKNKVLAEKIYHALHFKLKSYVQDASSVSDNLDFQEFLLEKDTSISVIDLHHELSGPAYLGLRQYILTIPVEPVRDVQVMIITGRGLHSHADYESGQHPMRRISEQLCRDLFQQHNYSIQNDRYRGSFLLTVSTEVLKKIQSNTLAATDSVVSSSVASSSVSSSAPSHELTCTAKLDRQSLPLSRLNALFTPTPRAAEATLPLYPEENKSTLPESIKETAKIVEAMGSETPAVKSSIAKPDVFGTKHKNRHHKKKLKEQVAEVAPSVPNTHTLFGMPLPTLPAFPTLRKNPCKMFQDKIGEFAAFFSNYRKAEEHILERMTKMDALRDRQAAQREEGKKIKERRLARG